MICLPGTFVGGRLLCCRVVRLQTGCLAEALDRRLRGQGAKQLHEENRRQQGARQSWLKTGVERLHVGKKNQSNA
jgi:hypothetical protein